MVKLGIICEGESEGVIFKSENFISLLNSIGIELIDVQETGAKNQFYGERLNAHRQILIDKGATQVIALLDLDKDQCITVTKEKVLDFPNQSIVVAVKEFENWYLADTNALSSFLGRYIEEVNFPEMYVEAIDEMINLKGFTFPKSKPKLAKKMINSGFSIQNAASHPNCPSANYFLTKLKQCASTNPVE
ncbi:MULTISPECIES: hypothetical protein [unclassified Arcicella]|uniref:hypothetical protein n=1 Tax=unclassified Arcicella TaxID=2644986 RepID=UPI00285D15E3|nr:MULTISPECIES: hypothetical protein [unclassified Arcicella]MDR6562562.1 hypothetical protein [Arcicella sp. BE51]MDR6812649.1 hypothetical protein [Arcicella sp. BE140]MDR6823961.1 hypothetical protein [Arcicella sp. BE139]